MSLAGHTSRHIRETMLKEMLRNSRQAFGRNIGQGKNVALPNKSSCLEGTCKPGARLSNATASRGERQAWKRRTSGFSAQRKKTEVSNLNNI